MFGSKGNRERCGEIEKMIIAVIESTEIPWDFGQWAASIRVLPFTNENRHAFAWRFETPRIGLEPITCRLTAGRSTIELSGTELAWTPRWGHRRVVRGR